MKAVYCSANSAPIRYTNHYNTQLQNQIHEIDVRKKIASVNPETNLKATNNTTHLDQHASLRIFRNKMPVDSMPCDVLLVITAIGTQSTLEESDISVLEHMGLHGTFVERGVGTDVTAVHARLQRIVRDV